VREGKCRDLPYHSGGVHGWSEGNPGTKGNADTQRAHAEVRLEQGRGALRMGFLKQWKGFGGRDTGRGTRSVLSSCRQPVCICEWGASFDMVR
jgi:hypothetical protein